MPKRSPDQIRAAVTNLMVEAIKDGVPPWRKPWASSPNVGMPCNFQSGRHYSGINPLILLINSMYHEPELESKHWGTSASWMKALGVHPKAGSKATYITLFKMIPKTDPKTGKVETNSKGEKVCFPMLREYPVFNADQMTAPSVEVLLNGKCGKGRTCLVKSLLGLTDRDARTKVTTKAELLEIADRNLLKCQSKGLDKKTRQKIAEAIHEGIASRLRLLQVDLTKVERNTDPDFGPAEELLKLSGADIRHGGSKAFYRPRADFINLPPKRSFNSMGDYYETAFHELAHWARGKGRVPDLYDKRKHTYAFEELVAEISSCFLMLEVGVPMADEMLTSSRAYVKKWLEGMDNDVKFIFDASTQASKVVDFLLGFVGRANAPYEDSEEKERDAA